MGALSTLWDRLHRARRRAPLEMEALPAPDRRIPLKTLKAGRPVVFELSGAPKSRRRVAMAVGAVSAQAGRVFFEEMPVATGPVRRIDAGMVEKVIGSAGETMSADLFITQLGVCGVELACARNTWAQTPLEMRGAA